MWPYLSPVNSGTEKEVQPEWRVGAMGTGVWIPASAGMTGWGLAGWRLGESASWLVSVEGDDQPQVGRKVAGFLGARGICWGCPSPFCLNQDLQDSLEFGNSAVV